ncbi:MAG: hypothetical protein ACTSVI_16600 [Promethearchaeota archaeon]
MSIEEKFSNILKNYMYKIAGINQMIITEKNTGNIITSHSRFSRKNDINEIAGISYSLVKLSESANKDLDCNIFEFNTGEKLFTINGGNSVVLSAISDKNVNMGISRMYLKKFAESLDKNYEKMQKIQERKVKTDEIAEILKALSGN